MSGQSALNISGSPDAIVSAQAIVCRLLSDIWYDRSLGAFGDDKLEMAVKSLEEMGLPPSKDLSGAVKLFTDNDNALLELFHKVRLHVGPVSNKDDEVKTKLAERLGQYRKAESETQHANHALAKQKREDLEQMIWFLDLSPEKMERVIE